MRAQLSASPSGSQPSAADNAEIPATPGGNVYEAGVYHAGGAPTSSRRAASCGSTSIPGPRWLWQSGSQPEGTAQWTEYSLEVSATIEEAFASGFEAVPVDAERLVNFRLMRQERCGAPNRSRAVRREPSSGARGPAAEHLERVAHSDGQGRERADASASTKRPRSEDPAEEQRQPIMRGSADVSQRLAWRFTRLHPGWRLPSSVNESAVGLSDLLSASELDGATEVIASLGFVSPEHLLRNCRTVDLVARCPRAGGRGACRAPHPARRRPSIWMPAALLHPVGSCTPATPSRPASHSSSTFTMPPPVPLESAPPTPPACPLCRSTCTTSWSTSTGYSRAAPRSAPSCSAAPACSESSTVKSSPPQPKPLPALPTAPFPRCARLRAWSRPAACTAACTRAPTPAPCLDAS
eukprot:scaffold4720_cov106-Isochrysis_galbana.AAC.4